MLLALSAGLSSALDPLTAITVMLKDFQLD
jgi:hypothetical protein